MLQAELYTKVHSLSLGLYTQSAPTKFGWGTSR